MKIKLRCNSLDICLRHICSKYKPGHLFESILENCDDPTKKRIEKSRYF